MRKLLLLFITLIVVAGSLGAVTGTAWAQEGTPEREINWLYIPLSKAPGRTWIDSSGGFHVRGGEEFGGLKGDMWGDTVLTYNADLDLVTGDGLAYGMITISALEEVLWQGTWTQLIENHKVIDGSLTAEGQGIFAGLTLVAINCYQQDSMYNDNGMNYLVFGGYIQSDQTVRIY